MLQSLADSLRAIAAFIEQNAKAIVVVLFAAAMGYTLGYLTHPGVGVGAAIIFLWISLVVAQWEETSEIIARRHAEEAELLEQRRKNKFGAIHITRICPCNDCHEHRRRMYFEGGPTFNSGHPELTEAERKDYLRSIARTDGYKWPPPEYGGRLYGQPVAGLAQLVPRSDKES